jgi:cytoskeletal protein CcmA (bactofilin family)
MFGTKKPKPTPLLMGQEKFDTLIGRHAEIHGHLVFQESVRIDGTVIGDLQAADGHDVSVVVGPTGVIHGNVVARRVIVSGRIEGNVHAHELVELHASAVVQGDINYKSIAVEHGSRLQGLLLQMDGVPSGGDSTRQAEAAIRSAKQA